MTVMLLFGSFSSAQYCAEGEATWTVGSNTYTSFTAALNAAGSSGVVKLASDGILNAGTYTIPSGVKVVIPYDASTYTTATDPTGVGNSYTKPSPFRTLTMASGANIIVSNNARLLVDGRYSAMGQANAYNGTTTGPYGKVIMNRGSSITVQSGGELAAYGYITGPNNNCGTVTALSGAKVREYMQIKDFRGGTATSGMLNNSQKVFPFSQYYIQNVEVPLTLYAGSHDYIYSAVYMSIVGLTKTGAVEIFGSSGLFKIVSGSITKTYDSARDRLKIDIEGDVELNSFTITIYRKMDTSRYVMPINNNVSLHLKSGTTSINSAAELLPGVQVLIDEGATLKISSGVSAYVYDRNTWYRNSYVIPVDLVNGNYYYPLNYVAARNGAPVSRTLDNVQIDNNGLIDIQGSMYSTSERTVVTTSRGTGIVRMTSAAPADGTTYQAKQDGTSISYQSIPVTSLVLTNGDNTSTLTKGSAAGTEYFYCQAHNKWEKAPYHTVTFDPNGAVGDLYTQNICRNECMLIPNHFHREGYSFNGWNTKADGSGTAYSDKGSITSSADVTLYAQWKSHEHNYQVVRWNWNGYTSATVDVVCSDDNSHTATLTASISEIIVSNPNCTVTGQKKYTAIATYLNQNFTDTKTREIPATGHTPGQPVRENEVAPTCTADGSYDEVVYCTVCNAEISRTPKTIPATGHTAMDPVRENEVASTCIKDGSYDTVVYCSVCHSEISRTTTVLPATGHTPGQPVRENEVAPTCTADGSYDEVIYCTVCNAEISRTTSAVSRTGHNWSDWIFITEPTCEETGEKQRTCSICSEVQKETVATLGHDLSFVEQVDPKCESNGVKAHYKCSRCPQLFLDADGTVAVTEEELVIEKIGHKWKFIDFTWNGYESAVANYKCLNDESHKTNKTVNVTEGLPYDPLCDVDGYNVYIATINAEDSPDGLEHSETRKETVPRLGHNWGEWVVTEEPTCRKTGTKTRTCQRCGSSESEVIPMLEHQWNEPEYIWDGYTSVTASMTCRNCDTAETETVDTASTVSLQPTCTAKGKTTYTAVFTNKAFVKQTKTVEDIEPLGHDFGDWTVTTPASCTQAGEETRYCSRCDAIEKRTVEALGHSPAEKVIENKIDATCSKDGSYDEVVYCERCHEELSREKKTIVSTGHQWSEWVTTIEATCTGTGEKTRTCSRCNETEKQIIDALGHDLIHHEACEATCTESGITGHWECSRCHKLFSDAAGSAEISQEQITIVPEGHQFGEWTVTKEPNCTEAGEETRTCTKCNAVQTRSIEAIGHAFVHFAEVPSECEKTGTKEYWKCSVCGSLFLDEDGTHSVTAEELVIPAKEHVPFAAIKENEIPETCTEGGSYDLVVYCSVCHKELSRETVHTDPTGHTWSDWTVIKEPTCTEKGSKERECSVCHSKETEDISALGHLPGEVGEENRVEPTCETDGSYDLVIHCTRCNEIISSEPHVIPATGHTPGETVIENNVNATCTTAGSYDEVVYCTVCHKELSRVHKIGEPLGHLPGEKTIENEVKATCENEGSYDEVIYCDRCNEELSRNKVTVKALGHKYGEPEYSWSDDLSKVTARAVCQNDKSHVIEETVDTVSEVTKEAMCDTKGETTYTAQFRSELFKEQSKTVANIDALGHRWKFNGFKWSADYSSANAEFICEADKGHVMSVPAQLDKREVGSQIIYTATVKDFEGNIHTETQEVTVSDEVIRVFGDNRYLTSLKTAKYLKELQGIDKFDKVVVTTGEAFPDALSGSYLANMKNAPVILIREDKKGIVCDFIKENLDENGTIYMLGGKTALPEDWLSGLSQKKERIAGNNRYITNINILKKAGYNGGEILVCTGNDFADSLSASAVNMPILLVKDQLTDEQKAYLKQFSDIRFTIIGGTSAVSSEVEKELAEYGTVAERIAGFNRFATSAEIAKRFFPEASQAVLAYGRTFPDGLSGGPLAYTLKAPLLLAESVDNSVVEATKYCADRNISSGTVLGGPTLIEDEFVRKIFKLDDNVIISEFE